MNLVREAVELLEKQIAEGEEQIEKLRSAVRALGGSADSPAFRPAITRATITKRAMSVEARERIAEAQRRRWAERANAAQENADSAQDHANGTNDAANESEEELTNFATSPDFEMTEIPVEVVEEIERKAREQKAAEDEPKAEEDTQQGKKPHKAKKAGSGVN
jgi:hypothetical protein